MKQLKFKIQTPPEEGGIIREADGVKQIGFVTKVNPVLHEPDMFIVTIEVDDVVAEKVLAGSNPGVSIGVACDLG